MSIEMNLNAIRERIRDAESASGRAPGSVRLLAVSKTFPLSDVLEAHRRGQCMFGENRVQELETKVPGSPGTLEWHLIGHLQSNKAAKAVELADWIHAVDSEKLAAKIALAAEARGKRQNILLEVNVSGEESKFGIRTWDELLRTAISAFSSPHLHLGGLMTMAPLDAEDRKLHHYFSELRRLRDRLEKELSVELPELSMGMSGDFEIAVAEGATIVRIGTAIFGGRDYPVQ